jgi:hypothetical protein
MSKQLIKYEVGDLVVFTPWDAERSNRTTGVVIRRSSFQCAPKWVVESGFVARTASGHESMGSDLLVRKNLGPAT